MIEYEPGRWSLTFALQIRGSTLPRASAIAAPCGILAALLNVMLTHYDIAHELGDASNYVTAFSGFSLVLGWLIVTRTQKGYARWWEAGTLLQQLRGDWFNAVSNLMAFCNADPEKFDDVRVFQHVTVRLFSLLYGNALRQVATMEDKRLEFLDLSGFDPDSLQHLHVSHDGCELVLQWIQRLIVEKNADDTIKIAPPILARVYNQLGAGIVKLNNARKIKEFPIPFPLAQMVTVLLLFHWVTTSVLCALALQNPVSAGLAAFVVISAYWGANYMAVELEDPYGDDANDLPLQEMQRDMNSSLRALIHPKALTVPRYNFIQEREEPMSSENVDIEEYVDVLKERAENGWANSFTESSPRSHVLSQNCEVNPFHEAALETKKSSRASKTPAVHDCISNATGGQATDSNYLDDEEYFKIRPSRSAAAQPPKESFVHDVEPPHPVESADRDFDAQTHKSDPKLLETRSHLAAPPRLGQSSSSHADIEVHFADGHLSL